MLGPCWQKLFALNCLASDHSAICPATLSCQVCRSSHGYTPTHMIRQSDAVYPHGNYCPCQGSHEDVRRQPGPETKHPHPGIDVAAPSNEPKTTIERPQFVELFPQPHMPGIVEQVIEQIAHHQTAPYPPPLRIICTGDKKACYGKIPRMFHEKVEDML